jgi:hypothetical protein
MSALSALTLLEGRLAGPWGYGDSSAVARVRLEERVVDVLDVALETVLTTDRGGLGGLLGQFTHS